MRYKLKNGAKVSPIVDIVGDVYTFDSEPDHSSLSDILMSPTLLSESGEDLGPLPPMSIIDEVDKTSFIIAPISQEELYRMEVDSKIQYLSMMTGVDL